MSETSDDLKQRAELFERVLTACKPERYTYLIATGAAVLLLLAFAVLALARGSWELGLTMFGPTGVIAVLINRSLHVFNRGLGVVFGDRGGAGDG
jgi:hypothetical protein